MKTFCYADVWTIYLGGFGALLSLPCSVIVEGKPNQLYTQGMRSFEQYDEICKYFTEGKQRDNDANEIQKHLQLYDLSSGEYLVNKYALWLDSER